MRALTRFLCLLLAASAALHARPAAACAACYGKSDSPLAAGMNWGIFSLLVVIVLVLAGIASFFVYLARKSATAADAAPQPGELLEATQKA